MVYCVYMARCADETLYTGIAKDVAARIKIHNAGKGAKYTRSRLPVELAYQEPCLDRSQALKRERAVKSLTRRQKEELILTGAMTQEESMQDLRHCDISETK